MTLTENNVASSPIVTHPKDQICVTWGSREDHRISSWRFTFWALNKVMVEDLGNTLLAVLYGSCLFRSGFAGDSAAVLHHLISTCKDPTFYAEGRSFYDHEQSDSNCPGDVKKLWEEKPAFRHSRSYRQEIVIGLEGGPVSLFSAS